MFFRHKKTCASCQHTDGNTCLYEHVKNKTAFDILQQFIDKTGMEDAAAMAKTVNNQGKIPLHLIDDALPDEEKTRIRTILLPLTIPKGSCKLSDPVDRHDIDDHLYQQGTLSLQLSSNAQLAYKAATAARTYITSSTTHPQASGTEISVISKLSEDLNKLRDQTWENKCEIICHQGINYRLSEENPDRMRIIFDLSEEAFDAALENECKLYAESGLGNCGELMYLVLAHGRKYNQSFSSSIPVEPYSFKDHAFNVVGRLRNSDSKRYETWGEDAVVSDAWRGIIYRASQIPTYLSSCYSYDNDGKSYNLLCSFNPAYHTLQEKYLFSRFNITAIVDLSNADYHVQYLKNMLKQTSLSPQDILIYHLIISPRIKTALDNNILCKKDLENLRNPFKTLRAVFSDKSEIDKLKNGKLKLRDVDTQFSAAKPRCGVSMLFQVKTARWQDRLVPELEPSSLLCII